MNALKYLWLVVGIAVSVAGCDRSVVVTQRPSGDRRAGDGTTGSGGDKSAEDSAAVCNDRVDNDGDGLTDCLDDGCEGIECSLLMTGRESGFVCIAGECRCGASGQESGTLGCANGMDDDCDGLTDCEDGNCSPILSCNCIASESSESDCSDGRDADCDGLTDCQDADCATAICRPTVSACDASESCEAGICPVDEPVADNTECGARLCDATDWRMQICSSGRCVGSVSISDCDDSNPCTDDSCNKSTGCSHVNNAVDCGDTNCNSLEWRQQVCSGGTCSDWRALETCADGNVCTNDSCADATGCSNSNNTKDCGSTFCNALDWRQQVCSGGACSISRTLSNCADGNVCTNDSCSDATGCSNSNNTDDCGGTFCSALSYRHDVCAGGTCSSWRQIDNCSDGDPCTTDTCGGGCTSINNPTCVPCAEDLDCDDGDPCTVDTCGGDGACAWVNAPSQCGLHSSSAWAFGPYPTTGGTTAAASIGPYAANREIWCVLRGLSTNPHFNMDDTTVSIGGENLAQTTLSPPGLDVGTPSTFPGWYARIASYRLPASSQAAAGLNGKSTATFTVTAADTSDSYVLNVWYFYVPSGRSYRGIKANQTSDADGVTTRSLSPQMVLSGDVSAILSSPHGSTDIIVFAASVSTRSSAAPVISSTTAFGGTSLNQVGTAGYATAGGAHIQDYVPLGGSVAWSSISVTHSGANGVAMHVVTASYW